MFMSSTLEASVFMGKNFSDTLHSKKIQARSHLKADVRNIWKVDCGTIRWDFWSVRNQLGKFSMETVFSGQRWRSHQSLACKGLRILRFCVMSWKGESEPNIKYCLGRTVGVVQRFTTRQNFGHDWWWANGIRVQYFPTIHHSAARRRSRKVQEQNARSSRFPRTNYLQVDVQWHHMVKDNEQECIVHATLVSVFTKRFPAGRWSFFGLGSEKKWYSICNERPRGECDRVAEMMMIKFRESGHFRATSPLSRGTPKSKGSGKLSLHFCADGETIEIVFRTIISVNQLSFYGVVSDVCEEYGNCQTRTVRPVLAGESYPLFEPAKLLTMTPRFRLNFLHKKSFCRSTRTSGKASTSRSSD